MPPVKFSSITALEENPVDVYLDSTEVLITIARNVLKEPSNPKYRSISCKSKTVTNKLLPACGAMECLFEMGFQEGEDNLVLSQKTSLDPIKYIHDELLKRREQKMFKRSSVDQMKKETKSKTDIKISEIMKDLNALQNETANSFLKKMVFWCFYILHYESPEFQKKALKLIPLTEIQLEVMKKIRNIQMEYKKKNITDEAIDFQEIMLIELCNWFNSEFFTWVDTPKCTNCGFIETVHAGISDTVIPGAQRVEKYECPKCKGTVLFPRYNDPNKLLETRQGRCGEWANCFCSLCRSLGWDTRLVFDETDHVWVEVYSMVKSKWIHCDPCENAVDTPLMYECGWKKKLSYVISYSLDEIQDVTWRYSGNHSKVLKNRNKCTEQDLVDFIVKMRNILLKHASEARRKYVLKRTVLELVELMKENTPDDSEERGRISGSLSWRLLRGETTCDDLDFKPFVWKFDKSDEDKRRFQLSYVTSKDMYLKDSKCVLNTWKSGVYKVKSVFKKDEKDWKMTYLARKEGTDRGLVAWRFEAGDRLCIGTVHVKLVCQTYESGVVSSKLCSDNSCVLVPSGDDVFTTDAFNGAKSIDLTVELFGGSFWQHAQIFRQPMASDEPTFEITIDLTEK